jgi:hypothetical protein
LLFYKSVVTYQAVFVYKAVTIALADSMTLLMGVNGCTIRPGNTFKILWCSIKADQLVAELPPSNTCKTEQ